MGPARERSTARRTTYRWEGVEERPYKEDDRALFKSITRQVLFSDPDMHGELRYFEVAPDGFSTLGTARTHARGHDPARARPLPGRQRGPADRDPRSRHRAADDLAPVSRHPRRAAGISLHGERRRATSRNCRRRTIWRSCRRTTAVAAFLRNAPRRTRPRLRARPSAALLRSCRPERSAARFGPRSWSCR